MGELLDEKQKVWVKAILKKDALFLLKVKYEDENEYDNYYDYMFNTGLYY